MNNKSSNRKNITKWILRIAIIIVAISLIMYSLLMTVENNLDRTMMQDSYQNNRKLEKTLDSERAAYQDTIRALRQKIEIQ
jgi:uncharacterized protein YpmB